MFQVLHRVLLFCFVAIISIPVDLDSSAEPFKYGSTIGMGAKPFVVGKQCGIVTVFLHSEAFVGIERHVTGAGVLLQKDGQIVTHYPKQISAFVFVRPLRCKNKSRSSLEERRAFLMTLGFEVARKQELRLHPIQGVQMSSWQDAKKLRKEAEVSIGDVSERLLAGAEEFGCRLQINAEGIPIAEAIVVTVFSEANGWRGRFSARL